MDIQTLGNLGEFIGSLAVLVTLVCLSVQTRQTVKTVRQKSHSDILARRQDLMNLLMNREFIEVWGKDVPDRRSTQLTRSDSLLMP